MFSTFCFRLIAELKKCHAVRLVFVLTIMHFYLEKSKISDNLKHLRPYRSL